MNVALITINSLGTFNVRYIHEEYIAPLYLYGQVEHYAVLKRNGYVKRVNEIAKDIAEIWNVPVFVSDDRHLVYDKSCGFPAPKEFTGNYKWNTKQNPAHKICFITGLDVWLGVK